MWTEEKAAYTGKHYTINNAICEPKPVQKPYPPILFGSNGDQMLRLAGRYGNICFIPSAQTPEEFKEAKNKVLRVAETLARANKVEFMIGPMSSASYSQREYSRKVEAAVEMGASIFQASFPVNESLTDSVRTFAKEIIPSFR